MDREVMPLLTQQPEDMQAIEAIDKDIAREANYISNWCGYPIYQNTQTKYYPSGEEMFPDMLAELEKAEHFLQQIFAAMHLDVKMEQRDTDDGHVFNLMGENLGILIGKHGQTLDALQYLANLTANHGLLEARVRIILDVENYRSRREETLRHLAFRLADKVRHTGEKIMLEPMNRHERKIIHMALQDNYKVTTYSAGDEPYRKVVIEPRHNKE